MNKKLILVAAPPACGKTYVSELISKTLGNIVYLDKDDLTDLVRAAFKVSDKPLDMDGDFYIKNIRPAEYSTLFHIAFSTLRYESSVLLNAPLGKEIRNTEFIKGVKEKANRMGAELLLIWVTAPIEVCFQRMKNRNSDRDTLKLLNWEDYVKKINYEPPYQLKAENAVDKFMVFDTKDDASFNLSLDTALKMIREV
jgi:predicted kinase